MTAFSFQAKPIFLIVSLFIVTATTCAFAPPALAQKPGEHRPVKNTSDVTPPNKKQVEALISPYKFGQDFSDEWFFGGIEKTDASNIVFYIFNSSGDKIFVWLTARDDKIWRQAQSDSYNMAALAENKKNTELSRTEQQAADTVFSLIKKNDRGDLPLKAQKVSSADGVKLVIRKYKQKNKPLFERLNYKAVLLCLFLIIATILFIRASKKLDRGHAGD